LMLQFTFSVITGTKLLLTVQYQFTNSLYGDTAQNCTKTNCITLQQRLFNEITTAMCHVGR